MNEQSTDPTENELSDDIIRQAIASIQEGSVPPGPPPELIAATRDVLKYPFRSRQVRDICKHLTADESRRFIVHGRKAGFALGILGGLVMYPLMFLLLRICTPYYPPNPPIRVICFIFVLVVLPVFWILPVGARRKQRRMLCETDYAKRMGFTPDTLPLHDFSKSKGLLILAIAAFTLLAISPLMLVGLNLPNYGDPVAGQIINRMARVYANCKSYRDSGVATTVSTMKKGDDHNFTYTRECLFTTAFVRSDRFRFEYKEKLKLLPGMKQDRRIIWSNWKGVKPWWNFWSNGYEIQTWWDVRPGIEKPNRFDNALAGVPAADIPYLLLRSEVQFPRLMGITEAKLAEDGRLDGAECFRVEGKYGGNWTRITLWIDKESYLVRRIDERHEQSSQVNSFRVTTTYDPIIDEEIADKLLEFDPPVKQ
jgi:hypothetical protein